MSRILVVTLDTLAARMAGPAIRAWEISTALAAEHEVRLVTFGLCDRVGGTFFTSQVTVTDFRSEVGNADIIIIQGFVAATFPWLQACPQIIVVDLYDPFHLESLEVERYAPAEQRRTALNSALRELGAQIARGDLFLCASEKQRDLWLGHLAAAGRINPYTYDSDPSLRSLITVVPFGTSPSRPERHSPAIKGVVPGISPDSKVVLWGGGVYNWFDPVTVVRAIDQVRHCAPDVRLYFLGMKHPNPDVPEMAMATRTRELSDQLGLTGTYVFFNEDWVAYERRADYLLDADIGVSAHYEHIETAFSFRTRILDYLWASLPIVSTTGDTFGDLVASEDLGAAVPPEDVDALADAFERLLSDESERDRVRANVERVAVQYTWPVVLEPLLAFCRDPRRARDADRSPLFSVVEIESTWVGRLQADVVAALRFVRREGPRATFAEARRRLLQRAGRHQTRPRTCR
ncbi:MULTISPECIES: glycosyltransferase family 4 protein [Rhodococcus]|uniref:Group 1 glycosyl transferase n=1 Tax=Rhodococcus opacus RKJ300 = JCM 13270 TaxID=1165867 RepID=I0WAX8_RHOOP|nr:MULTISPECIES: glycosyltransferase family 4 protein [Rhodococcus]EID73544.1 group 1 glycosyl transferase [Rhodococcus opacus RKJ300 = JCM 13270]